MMNYVPGISSTPGMTTDMKTLKYTVIKSKAQYKEYCTTLQSLVEGSARNKSIQDEIDLLSVLIQRWDADHSSFDEVGPVSLLRSFLDDHGMKAADLARRLEVSKGYVSDVLNYKRGMSKDFIRKLAYLFKVAQEAFNRPYKLKAPAYTRRSRRLTGVR
jgi:HTH-type transcriptional regulator/antitoxin HigA